MGNLGKWRTRATSIHQRCDPGIHAPQVGMDAIAREPFEHVGVEINQAWRDDRSSHLQDTRGFFAGDCRRDLHNGAILDGDIVDSVEAD